MEHTKHAVLRRLFTGVESTNAGDPAQRWSKTPRAAGKGKTTPASPGRGIPATGSVRERAKAFEERYAGNSSAYVPAPSGSAGQRPLQRAAKTSSEMVANGATAEPPSESRTSERPDTSADARVQPAEKQGRRTPADVAAQQPKPDDRRETPDRRRDNNILTSKTAFPPQHYSPSKRGSAYELPVSSAKAHGGPDTAGTPQRQEQHTSSPPPQRLNGQVTKPTLRAGAFQAARSRSNSTPRPSEWFTPPSLSQIQSSAPQTKSEVLKKPACPLSAMMASPTSEGQSLRVSALPISQSRKSRASLESIQKTATERPSPVATPQRPVIPQRSVSARSSVITRPIKTEAGMVSDVQHVVTRDIHLHEPSSARSENLPGTSIGMERAKSAPGTNADTPIKARPRSLTLTAKNPADLDIMFQEFIESLNLPETVSRRMLSVDPHVKLDMLRSGASTFTVSKATGQNITDGAAQSRMPIPSFGETPEAAKPAKKRPAMLRKMKSFLSTKDTPAEVSECFLMVEPTSPRIEAFASSATSRMSFDYTQDIHPAVSQAAAAQAHMIRTKPMKALDPVKDVRKLRVLLRNESLPWVTEWIKFGGYRGLMERLHEVVTLEWREEQHDDQVLLELLKCFRGLLMSQPGRQCLASFSPSPFRPLVELLFSEKKPGELVARQHIVEMLAGLFDIWTEAAPEPVSHDQWRKPWSSRDDFGAADGGNLARISGSEKRSQTQQRQISPQLPKLQLKERSGKSSEGSSSWESAGFEQDQSLVRMKGYMAPPSIGGPVNDTLAEGRDASAAYTFVRSLVIGPPNEKEEAQVYFIKSTRRARVFKLWMDEVIGVLSDYFCNTYWRLENIQEDQIEEPKVPGGMTGGVEYEAMEYCAAHLRLLNRLCRHAPSGDVAIELHGDLFASGIDKVLLTLRKCSTVYYPQVHLELARYIDLCLSSGYPLHSGIRKYIEPVASLKQSISAGKLAGLAVQQDAQVARKGHHRSRTDGQILLSKQP